MAGFNQVAAVLLSAGTPPLTMPPSPLPTAAPTLAEFEAVLAASPSVTQALETWCQARFERSGSVRAVKVMANSDAPTGRIRSALDLSREEQLGYRRVSLRCAGRQLALAFNWYVPARLTAEMNRQLAETETPFGRVAAPLKFAREPIPKSWGEPEMCPEGTILTHRALLRLPDGKPLAMVVECFTREILE